MALCNDRVQIGQADAEGDGFGEQQAFGCRSSGTGQAAPPRLASWARTACPPAPLHRHPAGQRRRAGGRAHAAGADKAAEAKHLPRCRSKLASLPSAAAATSHRQHGLAANSLAPDLGRLSPRRRRSLRPGRDGSAPSRRARRPRAVAEHGDSRKGRDSRDGDVEHRHARGRQVADDGKHF